MSIHHMCVIPRRCRSCGTMLLRRCCCTGIMVAWHYGTVTSWCCGAMLVWCWSSSTVQLHDLEVGFGCLHQQRSCGNIPVHSVFKGMNTITIPLLFNYEDRSWAMGVEIFFLLQTPTVKDYGRRAGHDVSPVIPPCNRLSASTDGIGKDFCAIR
jgi:hypothetical protein